MSKNLVTAIAEVTKLPALEQAALADNPVWHKGTPQASPVSWALYTARRHHLSEHHTLILIALAQHAHAALFSAHGYNGTTAEEVTELIGEDRAAVEFIERTLARLPTNLVVLAMWTNRWVIPQEALNGNWLDHAARLTHYGQLSRTTEGR